MKNNGANKPFLGKPESGFFLSITRMCLRLMERN